MSRGTISQQLCSKDRRSDHHYDPIGHLKGRYPQLRKQGTTIRKTNDCIIAATALKHHCLLLHNDKDFSPIAKHFPLKVVKT